jgi:peptidyl-prolyl cis-trans isomerase A (cyclophilin A)
VGGGANNKKNLSSRKDYQQACAIDLETFSSMMKFLILSAIVAVTTLVGSILAVSKEHPTVTGRVLCETTKGPVEIEVYREWSPLGADRFMELVRAGFYTDIAMYRSVKNFLTQFGISDKKEMKHWHNKVIKDDPNLNLGITRGIISYAGGGKNTRSTQLFIAYANLDFLGKEPWETPFGRVVHSYDTLDSIYKGYEDIPPFGKGPDQQKIHQYGNGYVRHNFPETDFINSCKILPTVKGSAPAEHTEAPIVLKSSMRGSIGRFNSSSSKLRSKLPVDWNDDDDTDDFPTEAKSKDFLVFNILMFVALGFFIYLLVYSFRRKRND